MPVRVLTRKTLAAAIVITCALTAAHAEWTHWRGPNQDGSSPETGLPASWTLDGDNFVWKADFIGRSTPVVFDGRVCAIGRFGEKETILQEERVACFDADTGKLLWDHTHPVYNTTVAFNRVGWASLAADPETGYVFAHGAAGQLIAFDKNGKIVWSHFLPEFNGRMSGYGGRCQTPMVYGDLLILTYVSIGWGELGPPRSRFYAHDKRTGEMVWISTPGRMVADMNTQGGPVVADVKGRTMLISGAADGWIYGLDLTTGEKVWEYQLSKRGINVTNVVHDGIVYVSHSEENIDESVMGRMVAIDASGKGNVTETHEKWRLHLEAGFPSPAYKDGKLYHIDNSANLHRIDAASGTIDWTHSIGTVGKGSAVWADGKLYATEVNGHLVILEPGDDGAKQLDKDQLRVKEGRYAEIYGSPAVAYGRVYFTTEGGIYAIGKKGKLAAKAKRGKRPAGKPSGKGALHVVPADAVASPGDTLSFRVRALDSNGRLSDGPDAEWSLAGLEGTVKSGRVSLTPKAASHVGKVQARVGEQTLTARARVVALPPWNEDFEGYDDGATPKTWISAGGGKFVVKTLEDGNKVLAQPPRARGLQRSFTYIGRADWNNYTMQIDFRTESHKRRRADVGLINAGYTLDVKGAKNEVEIRSWAAELRMARQANYEWQPETWYTMKVRVDQDAKKATVRGKVWKRGEAEPEGWTIVAEDPYPVVAGSPGIVGYAPIEIWYDNLKLWVNEQ